MYGGGVEYRVEYIENQYGCQNGGDVEISDSGGQTLAGVRDEWKTRRDLILSDRDIPETRILFYFIHDENSGIASGYQNGVRSQGGSIET